MNFPKLKKPREIRFPRSEAATAVLIAEKAMPTVSKKFILGTIDYLILLSDKAQKQPSGKGSKGQVAGLKCGITFPIIS